MRSPGRHGSHLRPREPHTFRSQEEADAYTALLNTPPPSIEDAKAAVASATDARDSAVAAVQFHKRRLDEASQRLSWKRSDIDEAVRLAVHYDPAMAALAAEVKSLATRAAAAERAFSLATGGVLLQPSHPYYDSTKPTDFRVDYQGWALLHRWREALEEIRRDPDAPLPDAVVDVMSPWTSARPKRRSWSFSGAWGAILCTWPSPAPARACPSR